MNDGRGFDGTSGVHTHMTNSRLTDPEVLELRFPVLLEDFHIREGFRRQGQMERRRRHQAHHPLPREDGMRDPVLAPQRVRRAGSTAAATAQAGRTEVRRLDGRIETLRPATRPCSKPARR